MNIEEHVAARDNLRIIVRTYFSIQHIQAAALFARECGKSEHAWSDPQQKGTENENVNQVRMDTMTDAVSYAVGTIFMARAFIEAAINEFVLDVEAMQKKPPVLSQVGQTLSNGDQATILAKLGIISGKKKDAAKNRKLVAEERAQLCLIECGKTRFNETDTPYQDVSILRDLRNHLAHYEVQSQIVVDTSGSISSPEQVESDLASRSFASSPFPLTGLQKYLCHGCCEWAIQTVDAFAQEFYTRMGVPVLYEHVRHRLAIS